MPATAHTTGTATRGFTLVELLVVLVVLVSVAALAISVSGDSWSQANRSLSLTQLVEAQKAVLRFEFDNRRWPLAISELCVRPVDLDGYDPLRGVGWRGPYLSPVRGTYELDPTAGFTPEYGLPGAPVPLDLHERPLVLQRPDAAGQYLRIVSAGPDGRIDTDPSLIYPTRLSCGDDELLYVRETDRRP